MYCGKIVPWENYPKHLRFHEVQDPLKVVIDFFSCGWPKDHRKDLKEWRDFVTSDEHYKDEVHGPGTLLFNYDFNLRFIEAMHLLLCNYKDNSYKYKKASPEQIQNERKAWAYFPKNLSDIELANPYLAVKKCFKSFKPQHYRDHLHEWLHSALYNNAVDETVTAGDIITVYEHLLKLYSSGWLIHQRESDETYYHDSWKFNIKESNSNRDNSSVDLVPFQSISPNLTAAEELGLGEICNLITKRIPCAKMIICLGTRQNPFTYYLVILINDNEKTPEHEIANKIEDHCRFLASVFAFVHKVGSVKTGISNGRRFWNTVMSRGFVAYQSEKLDLPTYKEISNDVWIERARHDWQRWGIQGQEFLKGAKYYIKEENKILALFMLHQAVESSLMALIKVLLGYRPSAHNLTKMLKITLLFTADLTTLFEFDTENGAKLFAILQTGYSEARYKSDFDLDEAAIPLLKNKVEELLSKIDQIYRQFILGKKAELSKDIKEVDTPLDEQSVVG